MQPDSAQATNEAPASLLDRALSGLNAKLTAWLERRGNWWFAASVLTALGLSLLITAPALDYTLFPKEPGAYASGAYAEKLAAPWDKVSDKWGPRSHESKLSLRFFPAALLHYLGLRDTYWVMVLGLACITLSYPVVGWLTWQATRDKLLTFLNLVLLGQLYVGCYFIARTSWDQVAILLCLFAFFRRPFFLPGVFVFLAVWSDERAYVASVAVLAYHALRPLPQAAVRLPALLRGCLNPAALGVLGALAAAVAVRLYLQLAGDYSSLGLLSAFSVLLRHVQDFYHFATFCMWEGGWLLVGFVAWLLWKRGLRWHLLLLLVLTFGATLSGFLVLDISRAHAYAYPFLLLFFFWGAELATREHLRSVLLAATLVSLLWTTYLIHPYPYIKNQKPFSEFEVRRDYITWARPLPMYLIEIGYTQNRVKGAIEGAGLFKFPEEEPATNR